MRRADVYHDAIAGRVDRSVRRILLVDDEPLVLRSLDRILSRAGWNVSGFSSASAAVGWLQRHEVDAAIVDYDLGDHHGLPVLAQLRDRSPTSVRVLMTGHDDLPMVVAAVNRGEAFKVLRKPFAQQDLLRLLEEARESVDALARASLTRNLSGLQEEREQLESALAPERLRFVLQPVLEPRERGIFGHEALLRPRHPAFPGPVELLLAVERHDRVRTFGRAVLESVAQVAVATEGVLFVNLHPDQLGDADDLASAIAPLVPHAPRVVLEITERSRLQDLGDWERSVAMLRASGFRLAVDDLGAGYSALSILADLQPAFIKLDRSLITGLHLSTRKRRLVQLLVTFGQATGAAVVAEGIEDEEELAAATGCDVDYVQGYLFGTP